MTGLVRLEAVWGSDTIIDGMPALDRVRDALYLPWGPDRPWGLFDRDGLALPAAWEPAPQGSAVPPAFTAFRLEQPLAAPSEARRGAEMVSEPLLYGGRMHLHFGHFLLDALSRLWPLAVRRGRRRRVLVHGPPELDAWLGVPWIADLLGALDLSTADFVRFDAPTICRDLLVPAPAFRAQSHAHPVFARLCVQIGRRLAPGSDLGTGHQPVYLSKSGLTEGVVRLADEEQLEQRLAARGVEIVRPERLPLEAQIALFASRRVVLGTAGSAFHTSIFAPPSASLVRLHLPAMLNSNHRLLDRLRGGRALDLHQPGAVLEPEPGHFSAVYRLPDVAGAAEALMLAMEEAEH